MRVMRVDQLVGPFFYTCPGQASPSAIHGEHPGPFWSLMRHTCIRESEADRVHNCSPAGAPRRKCISVRRVSAGGVGWVGFHNDPSSTTTAGGRKGPGAYCPRAHHSSPPLYQGHQHPMQSERETEPDGPILSSIGHFSSEGRVHTAVG